MKVHKRRNRIVEIIRKSKTATVEELAAQLDISRETIRRDLTGLARTGKIHKVHGGATIPQFFGEDSFQQRMVDNAEAKMHIADKAISLFEAGETLFMNTGATTVYLAEKIAELSGLTIVTNSSQIAGIARPDNAGNGKSNKSGNTTFLLGGEFNTAEKKTVGPMVISQIRSFRAHHAVLTIGAMDARSGAMDFSIEASQISRAMIEQSETVTVLMDASKYNMLASFEVCPLAAIDRLVVDETPPDELGESLEAAGVEIVLAR